MFFKEAIRECVRVAYGVKWLGKIMRGGSEWKNEELRISYKRKGTK